MKPTEDASDANDDNDIDRRQSLAVLFALREKADAAYKEAKQISWFRVFAKDAAIQRARVWIDACEIAYLAVTEDT